MANRPTFFPASGAIDGSAEYTGRLAQAQAYPCNCGPPVGTGSALICKKGCFRNSETRFKEQNLRNGSHSISAKRIK